MNKMKTYKCSECNTIYLECELMETKCFENYVGSFIKDYCPRCCNKRKPKIVKLIEYEPTVKEYNLLCSSVCYDER